MVEMMSVLYLTVSSAMAKEVEDIIAESKIELNLIVNVVANECIILCS
mgnify:CR=1 FL=1